MTSQSLRDEGNAFVSRGDYPEALQRYAAALAAVQADKTSSKEEKQQLEGTLRSNRSLCCLKMDKLDLALAEAEKCVELRPDWPKAHFRQASAFEALGRLGDARLSLCAARRLAPTDSQVSAMLSDLRRRLFDEEGCLAVGEALDALEDFTMKPDRTRAATQALCDSLLPSPEGGAGGAQEALRAASIKAFLAAKGANTIFRRQNAMGDYWQEEARNGTMSLLSRLAVAAPSLEEELVRLNEIAHVKESGGVCDEGVPGCLPSAGGKSTLSKQQPKSVPPAKISAVQRKKRRGATARPLTQACDFGGASDGEEPSGVRPPPSFAAVPESVPPSCEETDGVSGQDGAGVATADAVEPPTWPRGAAQLVAAFLAPERFPSTYAAAAAADRIWAGALGCTPGAARQAEAGGTEDRWRSWVDARAPELLGKMPGTAVRYMELAKCLAIAPRTPTAAGPAAPLSDWFFIFELRRDTKVLFCTTIDRESAVPGLLEAAKAPPAPNIGVTFYEKNEAIPNGDKRRLGVAGVVAALAKLQQERNDTSKNQDPATPEEEPTPAAAAVASWDVRLVAVQQSSGRAMLLPVVPMPGSLRSPHHDRPAPTGTAAPPLLCAAVGLGAEPVLPGPKARHPAGSLEVRTGLAFSGPDGSWIHAGAWDRRCSPGALTLAAFLEASASWQRL